MEADQGLILPVGFFCNSDHAYQYAKAKTDKAREKQARQVKRETATLAKADRKHTKVRKEALKTHRQKLAEAQPIFNELRRWQEFKWFMQRGLEPLCISCQKPLGGDVWSAGHLKTAGGHTNTRFDPLNIFLQHNVKCNMHESGDVENYKIGLATRFGEDEAKRIIDHCTVESKKPKSYTDDEFTEMKKRWRAEIRELKRELGAH